MVRAITVFFITLIWAAAAAAQSASVPVEVSHEGSDAVGKSFAFALRDAIRGSNSFRLVEQEVTHHRVVVHVLSVSDDKNENNASAIAVAITVDGSAIPANGLFLTSTVHYVGRTRSSDSGKGLIVVLDQAVTYLRKNWPAVHKQLVAPTSQ
jgi:hypothetical protein